MIQLILYIVDDSFGYDFEKAMIDFFIAIVGGALMMSYTVLKQIFLLILLGFLLILIVKAWINWDGDIQ